MVEMRTARHAPGFGDETHCAGHCRDEEQCIHLRRAHSSNPGLVREGCGTLPDLLWCWLVHEMRKSRDVIGILEIEMGLAVDTPSSPSPPPFLLPLHHFFLPDVILLI